MKLMFENKIIEVKEKVASSKVKNLFIDELNKLSSNEMTLKIFDMIKSGKATADEGETAIIQKAVINGDIDVKELIETPEKIKTKDRIYRQLAIYIVDEKQLTSNQKNIYSEDPDSDFWLEQDLNEIEASVNSFRRTFKLENF